MKITECSRDAMQGLHDFIPTEEKISYLQSLLEVGFYAIDCGSFVSPKAIPQMRDSSEVLKGIDKSNSSSLLSVIIANMSGAKRAMSFSEVDILGFPFSLSETFQKRNTNKNQKEAIELIKEIYQEINHETQSLLLYYSMSFGNPYNDPWDINDFLKYTEEFATLGIRLINISDTVGVATSKQIEEVITLLSKEFPELEFGAHFHSEYNNWKPKIQAAFDSGCTKFDGAMKGFGGCPMAKNELVGNIPTEKLITFAEENKLSTSIDILAFESAYNKAMNVFG